MKVWEVFLYRCQKIPMVSHIVQVYTVLGTGNFETLQTRNLAILPVNSHRISSNTRVILDMENQFQLLNPYIKHKI